MTFLNIACVLAGDKYAPRYVENLFDMVQRNLPPIPGRFVCFTDQQFEIAGVETKPLPGDLHGWWNKLHLFTPGLFAKGDRVLFFDLDTLIVGELDRIAEYDGEFGILRDFYQPETFGSGVMAWRAGFGSHIIDAYRQAGCPREFHGGDQTFIQTVQPKADRLQDLFPGAFVSYKIDCNPHPPKGARVVCFHGKPKPHELDGWVAETWKPNGLTGIDFDLICNTERAAIQSNCIAAQFTGLPELEIAPPHDGVACIVGGGPSLRQTLPILKAMKADGADVFSLNGTHDFLTLNGIVPDYAVCVDARAENATFYRSPHPTTEYLFASQCHPETFAAVKGRKVTLFHELTTKDFLEPGKLLIGGGSTVGLKAMSIAHVKGYRKQRLFGMDSSYQNTDGHAYPQSMNDADRIADVWCEGEMFRAAPWMVRQVSDFQELAPKLAEEGAEIAVYGEGLLRYVASHMATGRTLQELPDDHDLTHLRWALDYVTDFSLAVDAGAHRGIWTRELLKRFAKVYAFEPVKQNFDRLPKNSVCVNAALGASDGWCSMMPGMENTGQWHIAEGDGTRVLSLDGFDLPSCGFLKLDVEGYELEALKGAEKTIEKYSPVILLEENGLCARYGASRDAIWLFLSRLGYEQRASFNKDFVFTRNRK